MRVSAAGRRNRPQGRTGPSTRIVRGIGPSSAIREDVTRAPTSTTLTGTLLVPYGEHALLFVKSTAAALGVTPWWVRQLISSGELRAINVGGHDRAARWRVDPEDLRTFMRGRESRARDLSEGVRA